MDYYKILFIIFIFFIFIKDLEKFK